MTHHQLKTSILTLHWVSIDISWTWTRLKFYKLYIARVSLVLKKLGWIFHPYKMLNLGIIFWKSFNFCFKLNAFYFLQCWGIVPHVIIINKERSLMISMEIFFWLWTCVANVFFILFRFFIIQPVHNADFIVPVEIDGTIHQVCYYLAKLLLPSVLKLYLKGSIALNCSLSHAIWRKLSSKRSSRVIIISDLCCCVVFPFLPGGERRELIGSTFHHSCVA